MIDLLIFPIRNVTAIDATELNVKPQILKQERALWNRADNHDCLQRSEITRCANSTVLRKELMYYGGTLDEYQQK
jgi:hypothetical protein